TRIATLTPAAIHGIFWNATAAARTFIAGATVAVVAAVGCAPGHALTVPSASGTGVAVVSSALDSAIWSASVARTIRSRTAAPIPTARLTHTTCPAVRTLIYLRLILLCAACTAVHVCVRAVGAHAHIPTSAYRPASWWAKTTIGAVGIL